MGPGTGWIRSGMPAMARVGSVVAAKYTAAAIIVEPFIIIIIELFIMRSDEVATRPIASLREFFSIV
jgi:hypothetical protein